MRAEIAAKGEEMDQGGGIGIERDVVPREAAVTRTIPIRGMRRVIAARMHASLQEMAQLTLFADVSMDAATDFRAGWGFDPSDAGSAPSYSDLVIKACALALKAHPEVNARINGNVIEVLGPIDIGFAVSVDDGLIVPVVRGADTVSLSEVASRTRSLAEAARSGTLAVADVQDATFCVSSLGMFDIERFTPIINPPNVAILGLGRIGTHVTWAGDRAAPTRRMTLSLTIDHRALDGAPGAHFLRSVRRGLESPHLLRGTALPETVGLD